MKNTDRIWWWPVGVGIEKQERLVKMGERVHTCPQAVTSTPTTRESLDPTKKNKCRFCGQDLPLT